jgi:two-component system sensor histidine kinase DesK
MRSAVIGWWQERREADRFDLYTRLSLVLVCVAQPVLFSLLVQPYRSGAAGWLVLTVVVAHTVACVRLMDAALDHHLRRRPRLAMLLMITGAAAVIGSVAVPLLLRGDAARLLAVLSFVLPYLAGFSIALSRRALLVAMALLALGGTGVAWWVSPRPIAVLVGIIAGLAAAVLTFRGSAWMLGVLWELDHARDVRAELAVAQERLRFARDLHDVVGRQLSVVAVKSELAAQLAHRDVTRAVDEMRDVRTLAQQSLTELREVVRGYRAVDLETELAGARSVLTAAGIRCRVVGDGRDLPEPVQSVLAWVVREGVTNVLRHSDATLCTISLRRTDRTVTLSMENDGAVKGAAAPGPAPGSGLVGLTERVTSVGGELTAGPAVANRFMLRVELPR